MKQRLKKWFFELLGKDPEAVVVTFVTGEPAQAQAMLEEVRRLLPERRHFSVGIDEGQAGVVLQPGSAWKLYRQLRRQFRGLRIGMAPVLFTPDRRYSALRRAAFLLAPRKILAYNARLERHHLRLRTLIASWLFLRGVPLDRIFLRPRWLFPWRRDRSRYPADYTVLDGRSFSPGRPRVALVSPYLPYPLSHGGAVRIYHLLAEAARQFDIVLFAFTEGAGERCEPLLSLCAKIVLAEKPRYREPRWSTLAPPEAREYRSPAMRRALARLTGEYGIELRQVEYTHLAPYGGDVLVAHDVTFDLYRQIADRERTLSAWWNWFRWRRFERRAFRRFPSVVAMSEKDAALIKARRVAVIPNGVDLERFQPQPETPGCRLLFVGSFRHFPNAAAFRFFIEEVWPLVRSKLPEATFTVVAGPDPQLYWRAAMGTPAPPAAEGVRLLGFVADVRPLYVEANLVVVPTVVSAGTNLKVLEAMAMERAVVSTTSGCAGLGLEHGASVWIADRAGDFADAVVLLLGDAELRRRIARAARRLAEVRYDWREIGRRQRELWRDLLSQKVAIRPARKRDLPEIARIQQSSPEAAAWEPSDYLRYFCRVATAQGRVAGFIVFRKLAADEGEILNLAVDPAFRRRGVARRLMEAVVGARKLAWLLEVRESNTAALGLYRKLGFVEIYRRPGYYQDTSEAAVVMRLQSC